MSLRFLLPADSVTDHGDVSEFERLLREIGVTVSSVRIEEPFAPSLERSDTASLGETESAHSSPHAAAPDEGGVPDTFPEAEPDEGGVQDTFPGAEPGPARTLSVISDADSLDPLCKPRASEERPDTKLFELH